MSSGERRADEQVAVSLAPTLAGLGPAGARLVVQLIDDYAKRHRYAGLSPHVQRLRDITADVAAHAQCGPADVRNSTTSAAWPQDEITTKEAAELMSCSREHVVRLAHAGRLGRSRVVSGRRLVSTAEVLAYLTEKEQSA
jgi:excisionase family DNA binding protein